MVFRHCGILVSDRDFNGTTVAGTRCFSDTYKPTFHSTTTCMTALLYSSYTLMLPKKPEQEALLHSAPNTHVRPAGKTVVLGSDSSATSALIAQSALPTE